MKIIGYESPQHKKFFSLKSNNVSTIDYTMADK
jgi:hypothetical protein